MRCRWVVTGLTAILIGALGGAVGKRLWTGGQGWTGSSGDHVVSANGMTNASSTPQPTAPMFYHDAQGRLQVTPEGLRAMQRQEEAEREHFAALTSSDPAVREAAVRQREELRRRATEPSAHTATMPDGRVVTVPSFGAPRRVQPALLPAPKTPQGDG